MLGSLSEKACAGLIVAAVCRGKETEVQKNEVILPYNFLCQHLTLSQKSVDKTGTVLSCVCSPGYWCVCRAGGSSALPPRGAHV